MKLRRMAVAAALGATVLTTVPAITTPFTAYASCNDDHSSCGDDDPPYDDSVPDDPGNNDPGNDNPGYGDGTPTGVVDDTNVSEAPDPAPADATLPTVVTDGVSTQPSAPADPGIPTATEDPDSDGGGGGDSGDRVVLYSPGEKFEKRQNCYRNPNAAQYKVSDTVKYDVSYQASGNITAKAGEVLSASLGAQINTTVSHSTTIDVTLNQGESWALYVEYQTNIYKITSWDWTALKYRIEYVNVTAPTGVVTGRSC
ncbi:DUF6426 family protein [Streptomyces sp. NPDC005820]|uniref:DUF6426 family protein n=1 Tax=Streptomyces sp. NPDC005820 TaxID=3157069 RepID=UPI0033C75241